MKQQKDQTSPTPAAATPAPLAIDVKLRELSTQRRAVISEIVDLERAGAVPTDPNAVGHDDVAAAYNRLNGSSL